MNLDAFLRTTALDFDWRRPPAAKGDIFESSKKAMALFKVNQHSPPRHQSGMLVRLAFLFVALAVIFAADTLTDFEFAAAVFYVAAVLIAAGFLPTPGVLAVAALSVLLTIISLPLARHGLYQTGVIDGILSICAIGVTTYLVLQRSSALVAEHEARAQLTRLARVHALAELATSIAHEINQPLTGVVTSAGACRNWLASHPPNLPRAQQALERMIGDANRASEVVARVRNLSKRAEPVSEWIDAEMLVADVLTLSRSELNRADVDVIRISTNRSLQVYADGIQIQQVLLNMILNAIEAMNDGDRARRELTVEVAFRPEKKVEFAIRDTGRGLDPDGIEQIFDAFYSTKTDGIGIGLAISRSIIEAHGGRIWATANPDGGAEFHFTLPGRLLGTP